MTAMLGLCESIRTGEEKFQLRRILEQLRLGWKSWSPRASAQVDTELQLAKLPAKVEDYPPALRERLQRETLCPPDTFDRGDVQCMTSRVPLRSTNLGYHLDAQQREFLVSHSCTVRGEYRSLASSRASHRFNLQIFDQRRSSAQATRAAQANWAALDRSSSGVWAT